MNGWEFAIYKHSTNRYDPDEGFFPGAEEDDGTVEGALRAGWQPIPTKLTSNSALFPTACRIALTVEPPKRRVQRDE